MTPLEGEFAHLRYLDEEFAEEQRRHERVMRNLHGRLERARGRIREIEWAAEHPPPEPGARRTGPDGTARGSLVTSGPDESMGGRPGRSTR